MMVQTAVFYVVWVVMTYILTLSTSHTNSRAYAYGGLGLMLAVDMGPPVGPQIIALRQL